ncbi:MAG TPA: cellulose biosynthesis protein BcsG [Usitatibacter sp.]|nr:cellulose biosynthesis protein BcsG [Usitatibacter sp.]
MKTSNAFGWKAGSDLLGWWNLYFIAKLVLFAMGLIGLHLVENLAFAVALAAMSVPKARRFRPWIGVPVAIALLYYDSWLPGLSRVASQAGLVASFSGAYLVELAGRFVNFKAIAALAVAAVAYFGLSRFARLDVLVVAAMVGLSIFMAPAASRPDASAVAQGGKRGAKADVAKSPDAMVADFFRRESERSVTFPKPPADSAPFDVIFLHVCSMSWDDLEATGLDKHPLLSSFDIVLRRFNSVSTYSGPAAIRFHRGACGQPTHKDLYSPPREQCLLMPSLQAVGLEQQVVLNHDGHFDDFLKLIQEQGAKAPPLSLQGLAAPLRSFDDSRIYEDAAVLGRWLETRPKAGAPRAAVYYNTVSLHDGNRLVSNPGVKSSETYKQRLTKLLDDLAGFVAQLEKSGRRAVVVLVPEHGVALRGDAAQIPGLREIPTPAITLVPVMVKVVGPDAKRNGAAITVDGPTSYLAVSHIVSEMLAKPPFGASGFDPRYYTEELPTTEFVSEGETATIVRRGNAYVMKLERDPWKELE